MIMEGAVSASAIDSTVLDLELRYRPELAACLRTVATLGPSTIPPAVVQRNVPRSARIRLRNALLEMHRDPAGKRLLESALMERYIAVRDEDYDDIRRMARTAAVVCLGAPSAVMASVGPGASDRDSDREGGGRWMAREGVARCRSRRR
jgi:phosphonate transport system substrate-binding protein